MNDEARKLRTDITLWCVDHKVDSLYQAHMNYDVRSRIVDSWVLSHGGLLLIPEPTDGSQYFLDNSSNQVTIQQSMTTAPLELFHRMAILQWSGLVGGDLPSRNLERNFYMITKLDDQGLPKPFGWTPTLISHFPDFGAFGYEAILDNLFTGYRDTSHAHTRPLRVSAHKATVKAGGRATQQLKVKGGVPPYTYGMGPDPFGVSIASITSTGEVVITPSSALPSSEHVLELFVVDSASTRVDTTILVTIEAAD